MLSNRGLIAGRLRPLVPWLAVSCAALVIGMLARSSGPLSAAGARMYPRVPPPPADLPTLLQQLGVGSVTWFAAAAALPLLVWCAARLDPVRIGWRRVIVVSVFSVAALVGLTSVAQYALTYRGASVRPSIGSFLPVVLPAQLLAWLAVVGVVAAIEARRRALHASLEGERLRAEVAEQRLIALTGQLQPHFLFNTLQGISTLIHRDAEAADEMLSQLSELLRDLLRHRDRALVPLVDEMRRTRIYLEISRHRFGRRLAYDIDVPSELNELAVPLFILQPLVENALSHGIGGQLRGGRITVTARRSRDRALVEVADDGVGLTSGAKTAERVGLTNTRQRLRAAFGDDQRLTLEARPEGGTVVRLDLPLRHGASQRVEARR